MTGMPQKNLALNNFLAPNESFFQSGQHLVKPFFIFRPGFQSTNRSDVNHDTQTPKKTFETNPLRGNVKMAQLIRNTKNRHKAQTMNPNTYSHLPNKRACSLSISEKKVHPATIFHVINDKFSHPARDFSCNK